MMNDEVKEILDRFDKILKNYELDKKFGQLSIDSICHLFPSKMIIIKDCITNLQEENEDLKDRLKVMEHFKNSLQEENEKLKELCDKYEEEHNTAFKLWTMKMEEVPTYEEKMIYKSRCERAIEFIKNFKYGMPYTEWVKKEELLNILNGDE